MFLRHCPDLCYFEAQDVPGQDTLTGRRGFGPLHPWPSAQYYTYCLSALLLLQEIRRAAPAQVTACKVVTQISKYKG